MKTIATHSETETVAAGADFAHLLRTGDTVACFGTLGSGKTRFIKGICSALNIKEHVTSPTFTILREYSADGLPVYHWDFYRVASLSEMRDLGFEESCGGTGICLVEWADRVKDLLPARRYDVWFTLGTEETDRTITIDQRLGAKA